MSAKSDYVGWAGAGFDLWMLGVQSATVMGLRTAKILTGGDRDGREVERMVSEKMASVIELQVAMMTGALGFTPLTGSQQVLKHYKRKVAANAKRLG